LEEPQPAPAPEPEPEPEPDSPQISIPTSWFLTPFWEKIKAIVRPTTAATRREQLCVKHALPEPCFQEILADLQPGDAEGVERDPVTGALKPTSVTPTLRKHKYTIKKGSITDKIFNLSALDVAPPEPRKSKKTKTEPTVVAPGDEPDVYEVEAIVGKRTVKGRIQYQIKWQGWDESTNTWEAAARVHPDLVRAYENLPPRPARAQPSSAPALFKRGAGCARARLSKAEQRRGGVPTTISMVAGAVIIEYNVPIKKNKCPTIKITLFILTMDKNGFITWPTVFETGTQAALRKQARVLLQRMMDDPLNPVDETMRFALTQTGGAVRVPPSRAPAQA